MKNTNQFDSSLKSENFNYSLDDIYDQISNLMPDKVQTLDALIAALGFEKGIKFFFGYFFTGNHDMSINDISAELFTSEENL